MSKGISRQELLDLGQRIKEADAKVQEASKQMSSGDTPSDYSELWQSLKELKDKLEALGQDFRG